jgi:hypothetical protein
MPARSGACIFMLRGRRSRHENSFENRLRVRKAPKVIPRRLESLRHRVMTVFYVIPLE